MVPQKQKAILEDLTASIQSLMLFVFDYALNIDKKDSKLPQADIEKPILEILRTVVRSYRDDPDALYEAYCSGGLWEKSIRDVFGMDDKDEKGYWFYHVYGVRPNSFLKVYMKEHFPIALEKIF